MEIQLKNKQP
jgi:hypothetical protein